MTSAQGDPGENPAPEQLSLVEVPGPSRPDPAPAAPLGSEGTAPELPVARVLLEAYVPHLDRLFDYEVSAVLHEQAVVGSKVAVPFSGRQMTGWVVERVAESTTAARLLRIRRVLSPLPVVRPEVFALARAVAHRSAGTVADVMRVAVAPRVARVDKEFTSTSPEPAEATGTGTGEQSTTGHGEPMTTEPAETAEPADITESAGTTGPADPVERSDSTETTEPAGVAPSTDTPVSSGAAPTRREGGSGTEDAASSGDRGAVRIPRDPWEHYEGGTEFLDALGEHAAPRAVVDVLPSAPDHDWTTLTASAMAATWATGGGALAVVADYRALERLHRALTGIVGEEQVVRLHAEDGPTPRYRGYLEVATGAKRLVVGTRSAAYAPVHDLALVCCHDDADANFVEQRAPYQHTRDVLLLRAELQSVGMLLTGHSVSPEAQRLIGSRWAQHLTPGRAVLRRHSPRVVATTDSYHTARDPMAARARLPHEAFRVAREGLERGPVLVQVARRGYAPFLACERCRTPARCRSCDGPLALRSGHRAPGCSWCGRQAHQWRCQECGHDRLRLSKVGALRTAEELGRAFPQVPVVSSSGENVRAGVGAEPAVVVATPGAEPVAEGGYAAALLLDGNEMLARPWLRAEEQTVRRWFNAAALVRDASAGGTVVVTADHDRSVGALVRWDPSGHASRLLRERHELGLPPAVRTAALTGPRDALTATLADLKLPEQVRVVGPAPLEATGGWADEPPPGLLTSAPGEGDDDYRALLFFGFGIASQVTGALRAEKARASALREHAPVTVRCDVTDLL